MLVSCARSIFALFTSFELMVKRERLYPQIATSPNEAEVSTLKPITISKVPSVVMEEFIRSTDLEASHHLNNLFRVDYPDGSHSYTASWRYNYSEDGHDKYQDSILVVDVMDGKCVGQGEVCFGPDFNEDKPRKTKLPYIANMITEADVDSQGKPLYRRRGLAERRYVLMNLLSKKYFKRPMRSGSPSKQAQGVWEKLIKRGLAKSYREPGSDSIRYRFIR